MVARYIVNTKCFIEPNAYEAGTIIDYSGPYGSHLDPVNDEAKAAQAAYYEADPDKGVKAVERLPMAAVVAAPQQPATVQSVGILGNAGPGKVLERPGPETEDPVMAQARLVADQGGTSGLNVPADNPAKGDPSEPGSEPDALADLKAKAK